MSGREFELDIVERLTRIEERLANSLENLESELEGHTAQDAERFNELREGQKRIEALPQRAAKWVLGAVGGATGIVEAIRQATS